MAHPVLARAAESGGRYYPWAGENYWSVTTILDGGVPNFLDRWTARVIAEFVHGELTTHGKYAGAHAAVRRWARAAARDVSTRQAAGELTSIKLAKLTTADLAIRWLKALPARIRDAAGEIGTAVHEEAEREILERVRHDARVYAGTSAPASWPDHLSGWEQTFRRFLEDWEPVYRLTEFTVFNRRQAYAGTGDAIFDIALTPEDEGLIRYLLGRPLLRPGWLRLLVDYKSGNTIRPSVAMQLACYRRGEFIGLPDGVTTAELPAVDACAVLHLRPGKYSLQIVDTSERVFKAFLHAREVYRWAIETSGDVLLWELTPRKRAA